MKENKLLEMKNKIESLTSVMQHVINELRYVTDLSIGTLETVKNMSEYESAIEKLKENLADKNKEHEKQENESG